MDPLAVISTLTSQLQTHPTTPRTGKKKTKCIKASGKDYTIKFGAGLSMGDIANNTSKVLVSRVRGRTYTTEHLEIRVKEIWVQIF